MLIIKNAPFAGAFVFEENILTIRENTNTSIRIDSLIKNFEIKTTNLSESTGKIKEIVTQTILQAVKDHRIAAGS